MSTSPDTFPAQHTPEVRKHIERIGDREIVLPEQRLDVFEEVTLWHENPRLLPNLPKAGYASEADVEVAVTKTPGYDNLRKSIADLGQMEPVYAFPVNGGKKYLVLEGATRVTILRELARKNSGGPNEAKYKYVRAKILPADFSVRERVILLARIHVRGSGVRAWGRYIEAKFIHDHVVEQAGHKAVMSPTEMGNYMEKSVSWVTRLRDAYEFARQFIHHCDSDENAERMAVQEFSTLEECSKAQLIGPKLKDYKNPAFDSLRADVFEMVRNEAFREYRDARFLKEFHEDPEKWAALKSGERHVASRLSAELKTSSSSVKARIAGLEQSIERALDTSTDALDEEDLQHLNRAANRVMAHLNHGVRPFRVALKKCATVLTEASLADIKDVSPEELKAFQEAHAYFNDLITKHWQQGKSA